MIERLHGEHHDQEAEGIEHRLGMPPEQQAHRGDGQQEQIPTLAPLVAQSGGIEPERQESRRIGERPSGPEDHETPEPIPERPGQRRTRPEPHPSHPEEGEDEGHQHPQRGHGPRRPHPRQGEAEKLKRLERLRLRIGEKRHARADRGVPQRPPPLRQRLPHRHL
ncbi:MAG TPA: hypothetical protein DD490_22080 [Acidobacteria bacterium]|nr:hypothetical protein [Acidobacteriota bacterium]